MPSKSKTGKSQKKLLKASKVDPPPDFTGTWRNRLGSEMELAVDTKGNLKGKYRTGVGKPGPKEEFALTGFVSGDLIVFCVNFGRFGSLTSWAGQHTVEKASKEVIYTLWHLAKDIKDEDEPKELWSGILAGANEYRRTGSKKSK